MGLRRPTEAALSPNLRWRLDFVSDQMTVGQRFRVLTVVDNCTRERLALVAKTSISGLRVARKLTHLVQLRGRPETIVSDNGTQLTSNAIMTWTDDMRSSGTTSRRVSPSRTATTKASTVAFVTSS